MRTGDNYWTYGAQKLDETVDENDFTNEKTPEKPVFLIPPRGVEPLYAD